jgi:hypothetical protein
VASVHGVVSLTMSRQAVQLMVVLHIAPTTEEPPSSLFEQQRSRQRPDVRHNVPYICPQYLSTLQRTQKTSQAKEHHADTMNCHQGKQRIENARKCGKLEACPDAEPKFGHFDRIGFSATCRGKVEVLTQLDMCHIVIDRLPKILVRPHCPYFHFCMRQCFAVTKEAGELQRMASC